MSTDRRTAALPGWQLTALCCLALAACSDGGGGDADAGADGGGTGDIDPRYQPLAEMIEQELAALGAPGVAVAVIEGGEVTFAHGFGVTRPGGSEPVQATTLFRLASVTKMLTAAGLLQQVAAGEVSLDAPITDTLTAFEISWDASWAPSITAEHLLTHSSALADYLEIDGPAADSALHDWFHQEYPTHSYAYLMAPAGRMFNYNNPGFCLAGLLTEAASGELYPAYLDQHVFTPLEMDRTFFHPDDVIADGDYAAGEGGWYSSLPAVIEPDTYDNAWGRPAGYAFSSVLDLAEFVSFIRDGDPAVLDDDLRQAMRSPRRSTEELLDLIHYGYGLFVQQGAYLDPGSSYDWFDVTIITHNGAVPGFSSELFFIPELDLGVITLANGDGAYFTNSVVTAIDTLAELPEPVEAPDFDFGPEGLAPYEGTYNDEFFAGEILVYEEDDALKVSAAALDEAGIPYNDTLDPAWRDNFYFIMQGYQWLMTFLYDEDDTAVEYLRTRAFVAARTGDLEEASATPPPPRHGPEHLLHLAPSAPGPTRLFRKFRDLQQQEGR